MMPMKGITCCGDCGYYNWKKHHCTRASDEGDAKSSFYADCPLPDVTVNEPVEPKMMEFVDEGLTWEKYEMPTCGACGTLLGDALFCPKCGRAVKW